MNNASAAHTNEAVPTLAVGQLLDSKYRVDYRIGQGGMAAVWAGTNERTGKRVALKILLPTLAAMPGVDALFQREGTAASRVNHPNVVTVFDVIEHHGLACIIMELLDGEPLESFLTRNGALSLSDACALLLPALRGVAAAHAQGVIHRDLKPANIFVCVGPDGRAVTTKVLDFGISMITERTREPSTGMAQPVFMGTPSYMAPEQIALGGGIDERTDVYACGVLFYEALTGRVPFSGEPGPGLYEQILCDPVPPLAQCRPDLPLGLVQIIEAALAKEPAGRHANVGVMVAAIENELLTAAPVHVPTPAAGTVLSTVHDHSSGHLDEGTSGRRLNGPSAATKMMVGFPLSTEGPPAPSRDATDLLQGRWARLTAHVVAVLRMSYRSHPRMWAGVGIALVVVAGALVIGGLTSRGRRSHAPLPPVPTGATSGAASANENVKIEPLPGLGKLTETASPAGEPGAQAAPGAEPGPRPVIREGARTPSRARGAGHRAERRAGPAPASAKAKKPVTRPRAGGLSADDF